MNIVQKVQSLLVGILLTGGVLVVGQSYAQTNLPTINPSVTMSPQQEESIMKGKTMYEQLKNKTTSCSAVNTTDFQDIGMYIMQQEMGGKNQQAQVDHLMQNLMGQQGVQTMYAQIGRHMTSC